MRMLIVILSQFVYKRHSIWYMYDTDYLLAEKLDELPLPDKVYKWIIESLEGKNHS